MRKLASRLISSRFRLTLGHRRVRMRVQRAQSSEFVKGQTAPIASHMYGLLLRPVDRPDLPRR